MWGIDMFLELIQQPVMWLAGRWREIVGGIFMACIAAWSIGTMWLSCQRSNARYKARKAGER